MKQGHAFLELLEVKFLGHGLRLALFVLAGLMMNPRIAAQGFGFSVTPSANLVEPGTSVSFTIDVTNLTGVQLPNVLVTNTWSGTASPEFVLATNSLGTIGTNSTSALFSLGAMNNGVFARLLVTLQPTTTGAISNRVDVVGGVFTNSTNVVIQVAPPTADLAVSLDAPATPVLLNDWVSYGVTVTNLGTNTVSDVMLTNTGFNAMKLLSLAPPSQAYSLSNGLLVLNAGTLTNKQGRNFLLSVELTNAGSLTLSATVTATNFTESNPTNNTVTTNITVEDFSLGELIATNASSMIYNPQTGLMEQTVRLANVGTNSVASARVIVSGLTNQLYNAVGTNHGNPFVVYGATLDAGRSVDLLMEYFVPTRLPISVANSNYTAVGTSAVNLSAASVPAPNITAITNLGAAGILIEFEAITNRSYTICYSGNSAFTNALTAQPAIVAPANRVQWIDNGPPKTVSHPTNVAARFYRVRLNP